MIPATIRDAAMGSPKARLMYELCDHTDRLVSLPAADWCTALACVAWYLKALPGTEWVGQVPLSLILPGKQPWFADTAHNLDLLGVTASLSEADCRKLDITTRAHPFAFAGLVSTAHSVDSHMLLAGASAVVVHPKVTYLSVGLSLFLRASKIIVLNDSQALLDQAGRCLSARPRPLPVDMPLELILAGAA